MKCVRRSGRRPSTESHVPERAPRASVCSGDLSLIGGVPLPSSRWPFFLKSGSRSGVHQWRTPGRWPNRQAREPSGCLRKSFPVVSSELPTTRSHKRFGPGTRRLFGQTVAGLGTEPAPHSIRKQTRSLHEGTLGVDEGTPFFC